MVALALPVAAEEPAAPQRPADHSREVSDDALQIPGVFESQLPRTERKFTFKLIVHPHLGDLSKRDDLRTPIGMRYSLSNRFEISAEAETYFAHGLGSAEIFSRAGFSALNFNSKYNIGERFWPGWDMAVGAGYTRPVGRPPLDVTDGLAHVRAFATFARPITAMPGLRFFWGPGVDIIHSTDTPGDLRENEFADDSSSVTAGFVWERGTLHYTFESTYATTRLLGEIEQDVLTIRPGIVWLVPQRYTFGGGGGQWLIGIAVPTTFGPDGTDIGLSGRLRLNLDFKKLLRRK